MGGSRRSFDPTPVAILARDRAARPEPIILLAPCQRSGSHYLEALLALHPACRKSLIPEDFFLANSATLINFCRSLTESWEPDWCLDDRAGDTARLAAGFGAVLLQFVDPVAPEVAPPDDCRLLLRTPAGDGIEAAATLFPNARVVVLARDGPATVESGRRSFGWRYEMAMRAWRDSVRHIFSVLADGDGERYHLVRFEDIFTDPAREIAQILDFIGLDRRTYPFDGIGAVPVFGSSTLGRAKGEPVHWRPVARDQNFDPLNRARSWPRHRLKRFTWLAGPELKELGYPVQPLSALDRVWNVVRDSLHGLGRVGFHIGAFRRRQPRIFSDRRRRYLSWRTLNN